MSNNLQLNEKGQVNNLTCPTLSFSIENEIKFTVIRKVLPVLIDLPERA